MAETTAPVITNAAEKREIEIMKEQITGLAEKVKELKSESEELLEERHGYGRAGNQKDIKNARSVYPADS